MTIKQFVKSKIFRCIIVLLCIALVSGGLLAIMNDLLNVSEEERVMRTVKKIYGKEVAYSVVDASYSDEKGKIDAVYLLEDGNYLIKATGNKGYKQGTITIWCVAAFSEGTFAGVRDVSVAGYEKQTLMSKFTSDVLKKFGGTDDNAVTISGATFSATAANNAVNTVLAYARSTLAGGQEND
ncbi:MAG: hypothetical protein IJ735_04310 [Clostridia bacterium]|nr:hypothetical protein [Clostridia bacterium]